MADNDIETRHGDHDGAADQSEIENSETARGKTPGVDGEPSSETNAKAESDADADWGFERDADGMATETKIGLALILVLLCAFAFVVYRKLDQQNPPLAAVGEDDILAAETDDGPTQPAGSTRESRSATTDSAPTQPAGANPNAATAAVPSHTSDWDTLDVQNSEPSTSPPPSSATADVASDLFESAESAEPPPHAAADLPEDDFFNSAQNATTAADRETPDDHNASHDDVFGAEHGESTQDVFGAAEPSPAATASAAAAADSDFFADPGEVTDDPFGSASPSEPASATSATAEAAQPPQTGVEQFMPGEKFGSGQPADSGNAGASPQVTATGNDFGGDDDFGGAATQAAYRPDDAEDPFADRGSTSADQAGGQPSPDFSQQSAGDDSASGAAEGEPQGTPFGDPSAMESNDPAAVRPEQTRDAFGGYQPIDTRQSASVTTVVEDATNGESKDAFFEGGQMDAASTSATGSSGSTAADGGDPFGRSNGETGSASIASHSLENAQNAFLNTSRRSGKVPIQIYEVTAGDNYWVISRKMYGTARYYKALDRANRPRIADATRLRPGMKVLVPDAEELRAHYPDLFPRASTSRQPAGLVYDAQGHPFYRVGARDTLSRIAHRHLGRASRWIQIYEMNQNILKSPNDLKIGTLLRLPADASAVRVNQ